MHRRLPQRLATILFAVANLAASAQAAESADPVAKAVNFLSREVPRWSAENKCYSCHNNGDAARALYTAAANDFHVEQSALADTTQWLIKPEAWEHNGGEGEFNDTKLAAIQFAHALLTAVETGAVEDKRPLAKAAEIVAEQQDADGSWSIEPKTALGTPATYGGILATSVALRVLEAADSRKYAAQVGKGRTWLREKSQPRSMVDTAGVLSGQSNPRRGVLIERLKSAQGDSGGWGPYASAPPEPFDTAIVLLTLSQVGEFDGKSGALARGRRFLVESQLSDGSWPETTRPAGAVSYAQRISTAGWCTLALLATE